MAYTTIANVRAQIPVVGASDVGDAAITQFISQADGEIDIIAAKYGNPVPLSPVPEFVVGLSTLIVLRNVMMAAGMSTNSVVLPENFELVISEIQRLEGLLADLPKDSDDTIISPVSVKTAGLNDTSYSNFTLGDVTATIRGDDS